MWTLSINSSEIIEVLSTRIGCKVSGATRDDKWPMFEPIAPQAHFIWAEEPTGPNSLPNLIVTANGQAKEFLAWNVNLSGLVSTFDGSLQSSGMG